jgi:hypothetical protein
VNNHQKGYRRDRLVLETIAEWGTMDTEQLQILFYPSMRVAQRRLQKLVAKGKLKRIRECVETPYSYFVQRYDQSRLALNWARIWLVKRLKSWEVLDFDYSTATIRNTITGATKTFAVLYNVNRKTWLGDAVIVYDTDHQKREAAKRIQGELLTIDEIREEVTKCKQLSKQIPS